MAIIRGGKQRGHILGVDRILLEQGTVIPPSPPCTHSSDVATLKKREKLLTKKMNMSMKLFRSDDKFSQMLTHLESQPEYGGGSGSGGCGDDEPGDDEDGGERIAAYVLSELIVIDEKLSCVEEAITTTENAKKNGEKAS
ncbi:hypothetical protein Tco_0115868 [Tanacetum coccineum]